MLERMFWKSGFVSLVAIAAFIWCMDYYEAIARIPLGVALASCGFTALCWFDKYILTGVSLSKEIVEKQNIALAIVVAAFVLLLAAGAFISGGG